MREGHSGKTLKGDFGELPLDIPRDRQASLEPQLVAKHETRWTGFDDNVIFLYARGLSVREIQAHLQEMYSTEVSPSLISAITDTVSEEVKLWQARSLDALCPILYLKRGTPVRNNRRQRAGSQRMTSGPNRAAVAQEAGLVPYQRGV